MELKSITVRKVMYAQIKIHHFPELWEMMLPENITKENLLDGLDIENLVSIILMTNI